MEEEGRIEEKKMKKNLKDDKQMEKEKKNTGEQHSLSQKRTPKPTELILKFQLFPIL